MAVSGLAFGIGAGLLASGQPGSPSFKEAFLVAVAIVSVSWVFWAFVNYVIGGLVLRGKASYRQVLRALGVCYAPGPLMVLGAVPDFGLILVIFPVLWILIIGVAAMRETHQAGFFRVVIPVILGWIPLLVLPALLLLMIEAA